MPELVGPIAQRIAVIGRHHLAVGADGGQPDEMRAGAERTDLGDLRLAETAREGELDVVADVLAAENKDRMLLVPTTGTKNYPQCANVLSTLWSGPGSRFWVCSPVP